MAFERLSDNRVVGDSLDVFVTNSLQALSSQIAMRNAQDETRFNELVLADDLSLEAQLEYRKEQIGRLEGDPAETKRIKEEIAGLKDRVQQKEYVDAYTDKLIDFESGASSIDGVLSFLKARLAATTDEGIRSKIRASIQEQEGKRFDIVKNTISDQTDYAVKDQTASVLGAQIERVSAARLKASLAGQEDVVAMYDLQMQSLTQAKTTADIEDTSRAFAIANVAGYQNATGLLDAYNAKIASSADSGPVTIGGVRYDSAKQFWTYKRDSYVADDSANGFFPRFNGEQKEMMAVKNSSNSLNGTDVGASTAAFDMLASRPELQTYSYKINVNRQDALQYGADLKVKDIENRYTNDLDVNRAFNDLDQLKLMGANVEDAKTRILGKAADLKESQVANILATAQQLMKDTPGLSPKDAIAQAASTGAAVVLSPDQLVAKTETEIANDQATAAAAGNVGTEPRTTAGATPAKTTVAGAAPTTPPEQKDVSDKFGIVGKTVYSKATGEAFTSEKAFFDASGLTSFQNVKFDQAYQPPTPGASPKLEATPPVATPPAVPTAAPVVPMTYKVAAGDTLAALAQKYLGDSRRYTEIAKLNSITDPNKIMSGQELIIPNK